MPLHPQRLRLVDGMILVAGVAVGLILTRTYLRESQPDFANVLRHAVTRWDRVQCWIGEVARVAMLWLGVLSPSMLIVQLRQSRPPLKRVFRQPGAAANLAATVVLGSGCLLWTVVAVGNNHQLPNGIVTNSRIIASIYRSGFADLIAHCGSAVGVLWVVLVLSRRWRTASHSVERLSRLLGCCWILIAAAHCFSSLNTWFDFVCSEDGYLVNAELQELSTPGQNPAKNIWRRVIQGCENRQATIQQLLKSDDLPQIRAFLNDEFARLETQRKASILEEKWQHSKN